MTAHEDLLTAARSLRDQGHTSYSITELLTTARRYGSVYPDAQLRLALDELVARADDPTQSRDVFVEVRKGYYRLRR